MMSASRLAPDGKAAQSLRAFTLLDALLGRRSRRFGVGMTIPDGPLAYASRRPPEPIGALERALLILAGGGVSGFNLGMPHTEAGAPDTLCNYPVRPVGRTFPSGAGTFASELLISDDTGLWITRLRDADPLALREYLTADDLPGLVARVQASLVQLDDRRLDIPPAWPHISAHNRWVANKPGTSLFVPVGDQVDSLFNRMWIAFGDGVPLHDGTGRLLGDPSELIAIGWLKPERAIALATLESSSRGSLTSELSIAAYNIHLMLGALGLGGWMYSGINPTSLLGGFTDKGVHGFGFRFGDGPQGPAPLGLDGHFEPLIPPYVGDMRTAARRFAERKHGAGGVFDPARPGPYRDASIRSRVDRYPEAFVAYLGSVAQDVYDRFGRFPLTQPPVAIATYTQAQHIDTDYYDTFFGPDAYLETHARHAENWHVQTLQDTVSESAKDTPAEGALADASV